MDARSPAGERGRRRHARGALRRPLDAVYRLIRWIGARVRGFHAALGLFLLAGLGVALAALALLALLARGVLAGSTQRFDDAVLARAQLHHGDLLDGLALIGAALGSGAAAWITLALGTLYFWRTRHHYSALLLWAAVAGGRVLNLELKELFGRPRPAVVGVDQELLGVVVSFPTSASFPSGHAITSVIVFGTAAYLVVRLEPTVRMRRWTLGGALVVILLVGLSRVYLGVHYPSDVVAGWLVGFLWATACALAIEAARVYRAKRPGVAREEADLERGIEPLREAVEG